MLNYELRVTNHELLFVKILCVLAIFGGAYFPARGQSTNQSYPTAVTSNEISGSIKARDLGDARLTSYFYVFNATQGDVFINVVSSNLNGSIDVFTADGLKPLTKITVFADASDGETGRVVYLRKSERLLLRVEGRPPNDDPATFKIKFAGSLQALSESEQTSAPAEPKVASAVESDVRVNSVGTIIAIKPKPTPQPKETAAERTEKTEINETRTEESKTADSANTVRQISVDTGTEKSVIADANVKDAKERKIEIEETGNKIEVVVTENAPISEEKAENRTENVEKPNNAAEEANESASNKNADEQPLKTKTAAKAPKNSSAVSPKTAARNARIARAAELNAALENIQLVIVLKDGAKIEKPMSEILRVGVDKGILTVIAKDGTISRYSILEIAKMTIE